MDVDIDSLCQAISEPRIRPYRHQTNDSDLIACATYAWNIALCESFYPALNCFEVVLRNGIQQAAAAAFDDEFWFNGLNVKKSKNAVNKASKELEKRHPDRPISAGDVVAELSFGFWVGLFDSQYEQKLWPMLLNPVFPYIARNLRTRKFLSSRLHQIRLLRNRVFHHEPVWNRADLGERHGQIFEAIGWINRDMRNFAQVLDRFPEVYARGTETYEHRLTSALQAISGGPNSAGRI